MLNIDDDFKKYFPKLKFQLKPFQKKVIENAVGKDNTLCIMPTGGGKSVIYWMTAIELKGITIVVSPLIALISEQAEKLESQGFEVLELHGGVNSKKQFETLKKFANKKISPDFIFASPERIATDGFFEYCMKCRKDEIKLMVIDEVHCVSQWGISFRPFYKRIPDFLDNLFGKDSWCRVLALTATLNPKELGDICSSFKITKENIIKSEMLLRSEIQLHVHKFTNEDEKEQYFWDIVKKHRDEKILIYVYRKYRKRSVEELQTEAQNRGYKAVCFHGDMLADDRMDIIEKYRSGEVNIVFATNAFGMGIDIPDIRVVIHFMIPESAEQFYQEIGRAARDGAGANAYLLYSNKNIEIKKNYFIDRSFPNQEKLLRVYDKIGKNIGYMTIPYFEDEELQECLPYYINAGIVEIVGKGFSQFSELTDIKDPVLKEYYDSTLNHGYGLTLNRCNITPKELSDRVYRSVVDDTAKLQKPLSRWLVLKINETEITDLNLQKMLENILEKKKYKYELLDYLVCLLEDNPNSQELHQEIACYLGMDRHSCAKIYVTADGTHVRSKSEVIISNLLHEKGIKYKYEEKLYYGSEGRWIEPDFTIKLPNGKVKYWEHVGMLGREDYDSNWIKKLDIYEQYFDGMMVKTYESGVISKDANALIDKLCEGGDV
jgi:ATP-dependent DNA helicase RecQ